MVDGRGNPNTKPFTNAIEALYPVAYTLKFMSKKELDRDYVVGPLEALWWSQDMEDFTVNRDKSKWDWTAMIMAPDWITPAMFVAAIEKVSQKKEAPTDLKKLRLETLGEGRCVQTLHVGSFDDEGPVLELMHHAFIPDNSYEMVKKHHEIYLSDFRRVEPDKLRTILRQPVKKI